ncbi:PROTEIN PLANT CADMIUM RESISTANCE 1-RELATED [Salix viminalis]|uniref:PROTEIN PLANT CADMIUM RESISTANCE 1-RELATED n=2 Tax=Salix TaxID=40685 RepID=A0A9Q0U0Q8_SALVM|nr:hypothetical protein OIU84_019044 [Salix udensis]KAJ6721295.1 PROTEIN PLANT CADMIUM RESISTANCE 1-RELATED [Salix viminalis]
MYSSNSSSYDKFSTSQPPVFSQGTTTTENYTTSQVYSTDDSRSSIELRPKIKGPWSTGLCDCFDDWRNCCVTFWCPCITFGKIAEIVDKGSSSCGQYLLRETPCGDCLVHCCCEYCSLCQEYRELKSRGYDLSIGWHGNVEKKNRSLEMASVPPHVEEGMSR